MSPDGPIGALISAWPALALASSFELLMTLIRSGALPDKRTPISEARAMMGTLVSAWVDSL